MPKRHAFRLAELRGSRSLRQAWTAARPRSSPRKLLICSGFWLPGRYAAFTSSKLRRAAGRASCFAPASRRLDLARNHPPRPRADGELRRPIAEHAVRNCVWLSLALIVAGFGAYQLPASPSKPATAALDGWRRTADGWERRLFWGPRPTPFTPLVHPATVTLLAALGTLAALATLGPSPRRDAGRKSPPAWHVSHARQVEHQAAGR